MESVRLGMPIDVSDGSILAATLVKECVDPLRLSSFCVVYTSFGAKSTVVNVVVVAVQCAACIGQ